MDDFIANLVDMASNFFNDSSGAGGSDGGSPNSGGSDVTFGYEGRWNNGTDHNGYPVAQSGTGEPYYTKGPYAGESVDPNDVTWH